jgi:hypothetical protein
MSAAGLWVPRAQRTRRSYPPGERHAYLGELVRIDGSEHAWFKARGPRCTLLVYVMAAVLQGVVDDLHGSASSRAAGYGPPTNLRLLRAAVA